MRSVLPILAMLALLAGMNACAPQAAPGPPPTATVFLITSTLPARPKARPSETPVPPTVAPTSAPVDGTTTSQLNVRASPSAGAAIVGSVGIFTKVRILGTDSTRTWYQIAYAEAAAGVAWITASYVQLEGNPELGVISEATAVASPAVSVVAGASPANPPPPPPSNAPAATNVGPALPDDDSAAAPAVSVIFSPLEARSLQYTGDVSYPEGDGEDWIQFSLFGKAGQPVPIEVKIDCSGNSGLWLELQQGGSVLQAWDDLTCATRTRLLLGLFAGPPYLLRVRSAPEGTGLKYVQFTLTVEASGP